MYTCSKCSSCAVSGHYLRLLLSAPQAFLKPSGFWHRRKRFRFLKPIAMATVSDITTELADAEPLLKNADFSQEVKMNIVKQLATKIHGLTAMSPVHAQQLMVASKAVGLAEDLQEILDTAINGRLLKPASGSTGASSSKQQQLLAHPLNFLTKNDWIRLDDPSAVPAGMAQVLAKRLALLGIRSFEEETYRWLIAIILSKMIKRHGHWPKYKVIFGWLLDFKRDFAPFKTPWVHGVLLTYPPTPDLLPTVIFDSAYPDPDDPPVQMEIENFSSLGDHIPLRKNSQLLIMEQEAEDRLNMQSMGMGHGGFQAPVQQQFLQWLQQQPSSQNPIPGMMYFGSTSSPQQRPPFMRALQNSPSQGSAEVPAPLFGAAGSALVAQPEAGAAVPDGLVPASEFKPAPRMPNRKPAEDEGKADEPVAPSDRPAEDGGKAEAGEEAAFRALKARAETKKKAKKSKPVHKKPAAGDDAAGDDGDDDDDEDDEDDGGVSAEAAPKKHASDKAKVLLAKPSASPATLKRPAAAAVVKAKVRYIIPPVNKALLKSTTWKIWGSKVYHESRRTAKNSGMDIEDANALGRGHYKRAGDMWVAAGGSKTM